MVMIELDNSVSRIRPRQMPSGEEMTYAAI